MDGFRRRLLYPKGELAQQVKPRSGGRSQNTIFLEQLKEAVREEWMGFASTPIAEVFLQPEQPDDGFAVVDLAQTYPLYRFLQG